MNKIQYILPSFSWGSTAVLVFSFILLFACKGEDRSHEYESLTIHNTWMFGVMKDKYLFGDNIKEQDYKKYFQTSTNFFQTLVSAASTSDSWSYILVDSVTTDPHVRNNFNHLDSYGIDFRIVTDPTKTTSRSMARVTYIVDESPAADAGLSRNTFISSVDGTRITSSNATKYLVNGTTHKITFHHLDTLETGEYVWTDTIDVDLPPSEKVIEPAFPVATVVQYKDTKVAYLMSTRLVPYPDEQVSYGSEFEDDLKSKMQTIIAEKPQDLILDLRLCNYGTIDMAQLLASYIVPAAKKEEVFLKTIWNSRYAENNKIYFYDTTVQSLELSRIYIIMSGNTQGAAEWLIRALQQTLGTENVITIGENSMGQSMMTQFVAAGYGHKLYPSVCHVTDASNNTSYSSLTANKSVNENASTYWLDMKDFGSPSELLFSTALSLIFDEQDNLSDTE